jgi:tetraacyldisaccharide 4'-kinase
MSLRAPGFWWRAEPGLGARLLQPLGALYGAATLARMARPGADAGLPVICVGNLVAGGAGKTPTALAVAERLTALGETPFILSRGYGGREPGPLHVDPARHGAGDVGDEPLLMAQRYPVVVARDRPAGAALAQAEGATVIVMDDGLQNPSLRKDLRLAVVDGAVGLGNGLCLPAGPLRAPAQAQLARIDAGVVIGAGAPGDAFTRAAMAGGHPVLHAEMAVPEALQATLAGLAVIAASGIGRPEKFAATLTQAGARILTERRFGDHHAYTAADVAALIAEARRHDCAVAVTEKDVVKLGPLWPQAERDRLIPVPVALKLSDPAALDALLRRALAGRATSGRDRRLRGA